MKRLTSLMVLVGALSIVSVATPTAAWGEEQAQARFRSRLSDRQVQAIVTRIRTNGNELVRIVDGVPAQGRAWGNYKRQTGDVAYLVEDLVVAADHLDDHIVRQQATRADVDDLLRRAALVDDAFKRDNRTGRATTIWTTLRRDIDSLASAYDLRWDWGNPQYSNDPVTGVYRDLEGTYQLVVAQSDNPQRTVDTALRNLPVAERARVSRQILNRLDPPDAMAIDRTGGNIVIASSRGPQFTFDADGTPRTETGPGGQTIVTRASTYGDQLSVTTTGALNNEFAVVIEPLQGGQQLRVTRRIYADRLSQPIRLQTVYRKTSDTPDWNLSNRPVTRPSNFDERMLVPDGTVLVARLDQAVNLRSAREDDRITLTVRNAQRAELEGATIEGTIISTPVRAGDTSRVRVEFDQIRLRNGRFSDFDGVIERITGPNGQTIRFDGEQATVDRSSGGDALQRGAIGAAIGGLIGALAGGGKGAIIGAAIGGGGAAATVLIDDSSQIELVRGTEFTIRARNR